MVFLFFFPFFFPLFFGITGILWKYVSYRSVKFTSFTKKKIFLSFFSNFFSTPPENTLDRIQSIDSPIAMNEIIPNLFFLLPLLLFTWTLLQEDRNKGKTMILLLIISKLPAEREQKEEILENLGQSFYRLETKAWNYGNRIQKGERKKSLRILNFSIEQGISRG